MFININDNKIHYTVESATTLAATDADAPNIVILPGWGCKTTHYHKIQAHLATKNFKVYTIDFPGCGLSSAPLTPWTTENYAELIASFINKLQIANPILIGHSLGGKIAIYLIAKRLVQCRKLILVSSAGIKSNKTLHQLGKIYLFKLCKITAKLPLLRHFLEPKLDAYRKKVGSQDYRNASGVMRDTLVKLVNEDFRQLLPAINIPSLLLWGEKDMDTPLKNGQIMQQLIPQAKLIIFAGGGHFPFLDDFTKFINSLDEFLLHH